MKLIKHCPSPSVSESEKIPEIDQALPLTEYEDEDYYRTKITAYNRVYRCSATVETLYICFEMSLPDKLICILHIRCRTLASRLKLTYMYGKIP